MFLMFLRITRFFLAFYISLEHGLHEGHALIAPRLLVGLLGLRGLTCCCLKGLTIAVIATAVGPPDALRFGLPLALDGAVLPFPFTVKFASFFSTMTHSMASRSGSNVRVDLGTVE